MVQPLGVFGALENCPRVGALALEYRACVVQAVGQHMDLGVDVGHEVAVKPDDTGHLVEGHCHGFPPYGLLALRVDVAPVLRPGSSPDMVRTAHSGRSGPRARTTIEGLCHPHVTGRARSFLSRSST